MEIALDLVRSINLLINEIKTEFGLDEIIVLGYSIGARGIKLAKEKLLAMQVWKTPQSGKTIERHLGFFNYFREMIPMYSKLTAPLEKLRHIKSFEWTVQYQDIYDKLSDILASEVILSYPNFSEPFEVATDASNYGIGAVLYQIIDGKTHYISFQLRALSDGEKGYGATKRELVAIIFALERFR